MSDPACMAAITQAIAYITKKTEHTPAADLAALMRAPQYRALGEAIDHAARAGNVGQTQAACRAWWTYILMVLQQVRQRRAA